MTTSWSEVETGAHEQSSGEPRMLLSLDKVSVSFPSSEGSVEVVRDASFAVARAEIVALVGESGSGKTVTSMAILGLLPMLGGHLTGGSIRFDDQEMTGLTEQELLKVRGRRISMIFQQPNRSLNPAFTVGNQISETIRMHLGLSRKDAWKRAVEMLDRVKIANAERRAHDYPHMFSGGMCQRVMIAMALASEPELLIADEPTTALDVTVQSAILDLLRELQRELGIAVLYITHDLAVVAELCDRVAVMYAGETVEVGGTSGVFHQPQHPYTGGLLQAIPRHASATRLVEIPGQVPNAHEMPAGCRFAPRCPYVVPDRCTSAPVELLRSGDRTCRCVRRSELDLEGMSG